MIRRLQAWLLGISIPTRLGLGFGALVFLILVLGLAALQQMDRIQSEGAELFNHPFTVSRAVDEAEIAVLKIHRGMKDIAHAVDQEQIRQTAAQIQLFEEQALEQLELARARYLGDPQSIDSIRQSLLEWRPIREEVTRHRLEGRLQAADEITRGRGASQVEQIERELAVLKTFAHGKAEESLEDAGEILRQSILLISLIFISALILGIVISFIISKSIRGPLTHLYRATTKVSEGDLGQQIPVRSQDELGRLTQTFNFMVKCIREQTEEIQLKNEENERLLLNILPEPIADRLKQGEEPISDYFPEVTVLFADIVGFTAMSDKLPPDDLVRLLNHMFTEFDHSANKLGIEKIKTIGDCYMAVAGLTMKLDDPPTAMVKVGFEMLSAIDSINAQYDTSLRIRVGIHCGPVVAGVIGKSKFIYDLWGDTVNLASRMESYGMASRIHVSEEVYDRIKGNFELEARGMIDIKGKGETMTYLLSN